MYQQANTIILAGSVLAALTAFAGLAWRLFSWIARQQELEEEVKTLREAARSSQEEVNEEQTLIVYGLLACLKGLQELECDGPVTEAIHQFDEHLNQKAHSIK